MFERNPDRKSDKNLFNPGIFIHKILVKLVSRTEFWSLILCCGITWIKDLLGTRMSGIVIALVLNP